MAVRLSSIPLGGNPSITVGTGVGEAFRLREAVRARCALEPVCDKCSKLVANSLHGEEEFTLTKSPD